MDDPTGKNQNTNSGVLRPKSNNTKKRSDDVKEPKQDVILIDIASQHCQFFHNAQKEAYARVDINGHKEVWSIQSSGFADWLRHQYWTKHRKAVTRNTFEGVLDTLRAQAVFDGKCEEVFIRVAQSDKKIYIDICNDSWQVIEVSDAEWQIIDQSPVAFVRSSNMRPLPMPVANGDIDLLKKHINIRDNEFPLVVGWLLMSLQAGSGAYPILIFQGSAGTGKTTCSRMLRSLVDPNAADLLSKPRTENMRVIGANNHVLAFDNLSGISNDYSDCLCKISTGDSQTVRKLYTTNEEFTISIKKPILLNGIDEIARRGDLVSRSIKVELGKIPDADRKTDSALFSAYHKDTPLIFGALLDGLSVALALRDYTKISEPSRMGDFCQWVTAAGKSFDWDDDRFKSAYRRNIQSSFIDSLEASTFASAIVNMFEHRAGFTGIPLDLLEQLESCYANEKAVKSGKWVTTAKGVMTQLDRHQEALEVGGIYFEKTRDRTNKTMVKLYTNEESISSNTPTDDEWLSEYKVT